MFFYALYTLPLILGVVMEILRVEHTLAVICVFYSVIALSSFLVIEVTHMKPKFFRWCLLFTVPPIAVVATYHVWFVLIHTNIPLFFSLLVDQLKR